MDKIKKIIIFAGTVIFAALAVFAYLVSRPVNNVAEEETGGETGTFPTGGENQGGRRSSRSAESAESGSSSKKQNQGMAVLVRLTNVPVSGAGFYGTSSVLYMEKATGHIYKIKLDGTENKRLSNTTILKTFESLWSPKGDRLAVRYFEESSGGETGLVVKTFLASAGHLFKATSTEETVLKGVALPDSVTEIAASPYEDKVFYLNETANVAEGIVSDYGNKNQKKIFELPFGEFSVNWPTKDVIALLTKPSYATEGYLYFLNQKTGSLSKALGGIKGLTALVSSTGDKIVFSGIGNGGVETMISDLKKNSISAFGIKTFTEKCAWGRKNKDIIYCAAPVSLSGGKYPDAWYQGEQSFDDLVWSKNLATGEVKIISQKFGADIINPAISEDDAYLIFTDKNNGHLWSLKLK